MNPHIPTYKINEIRNYVRLSDLFKIKERVYKSQFFINICAFKIIHAQVAKMYRAIYGGPIIYEIARLQSFSIPALGH